MEMSRGEMQDLLGKFASEKPEYRDALAKDAKKVIEAQFKMELPDSITVKVVEDTADTIYVVLPHVAEGGELSDADLEAVAGGGVKMRDAECSSGMLNTVIAIEASLF
jgi:hypothetical protein